MEAKIMIELSRMEAADILKEVDVINELLNRDRTIKLTQLRTQIGRTISRSDLAEAVNRAS